MCGECCKKIRISAYLKHSLRQHGSIEELIKYYTYRGITISEINEEEDYINYEIPIRCSKLTEDNKCILHEKDEKPLICKKYPWFEDDIETCGYYFVEK